jgi:diketogulonate reductase-like aldo/keto reductase
MKNRKLGPFQVSEIGLGCMNLSHAYGVPVSAAQAEQVLLTALDAGVTFFDTAALYGFSANETLVGKVLKPYRQRLTLASKCGMTGVDVNGDGKLVRVIDGRPETIRKTCEEALKRLQTDVIDLYYRTVGIKKCQLKTVWVHSVIWCVKAKSKALVYLKSQPAPCAKRMRSTPSLRCKLNIHCGHAIQKLPCFRPVKNWVLPL